LDVVVKEAAHARELTQGTKIANERHIWIGCWAVFVEQQLCRGQDRHHEPGLGGLQTPT
jgi:hypothetical protein